MIYLKSSLDKRRKKNNGAYPIILAISYRGDSRTIPTGLDVEEKFWDHKKDQISTKHKFHKQINTQLEEAYYSYQEKIIQFTRQLRGEEYTIQQVRDFLVSQKTQLRVKEFWLKEIERLTVLNKYGNAKNYKWCKKNSCS